MSQATTNTQASGQNDFNEAVVQSVIKEISHIATLPEVTMKIVQLVEDPDSTAQDLNHVITNDPALGARILKVVNSAFYGLPGQIGSINRAIVLLGLNAVKNIAIAASLSKLFRGGQICPGFDARELWTHSIAVASATRMLASKSGQGMPDEAFLAGLIHDLGIMVEIQARRPKFVEAFEKTQKEGLTLREAENAVFGAHHEHFGNALCKLWKFPENFCHVTGFHHHPMDLPAMYRAIPGLVYVADIIAARMELGYGGDVESTEIDPQLLGELKLTPEHLEETINELPAAMDEASNLLRDSS